MLVTEFDKIKAAQPIFKEVSKVITGVEKCS